MKKESNEIDLLELLANIYFLLKRNKYIILAFAVIGIILGMYKSTKSEAYYQTEMIVKTNFEPEAVFNQLKTLADFRKDNNLHLLAQELDISREDAEKIKSLNIEEIEKTSLLRITLEVHSNKVIPKVKKGIIHFSQTNEFLQEQLKSKQKHFEQYLNEISKALEILQKKENKKIMPQKPNEIIYGEESYAGQIIKLMDRKEDIEESLIQNKPLNIVTDFHIPEKAQKDTKVTIILYFAIGLFVGIIVVIFLFLIKKFESFRKS